MKTYAIATALSVVLLFFYWIYTRFRNRIRPRSGSEERHYALLENHLDQQSLKIQKLFKNLMVLKQASAAMLIVAFGFFLVGGISMDVSGRNDASNLLQPGVQAGIFGWTLWGASGAMVFICEGVAAVLASGIVAKPIPLFTRSRFIHGQQATSFGIKRIGIGLSLISVVLFAIIAVALGI